ncbi:hypothetical protein HanIR_Chr16g0794501 [Helianthus annuus]|nr:hypothetical protein HanIR_Chr16g0794501 [Helianthus annuus]KAJ0459189.1 hypothetical protein HanHA89_Chr16g0646071 [Helianthus annuus]KAJ0639745.1 hypothetical protein HanLR1_Chr16g0607201 [Helianthus annuus]
MNSRFFHLFTPFLTRGYTSCPPLLQVLGCVPELKIHPHPSPPLHVFPNWKDNYQAKKTPFSLPSPPPIKWISGTQHYFLVVQSPD